MSQKTAIVLILTNSALWVVNLILHYTRFYPPNSFGISIQISVAIVLAAAYYFYRNPYGTKWFGEKLDASPEINATVSFVFSSICSLLAVVFNLYPFVKIIDA